MLHRSWDGYFMALAQQVATHSTCQKRQVGAVIVRERQVLATGYNGAPRGLPHCTDVGCLRRKLGVVSGQYKEICRALHAEQSALVEAAERGIAVEGATLYTTLQPCVTCAKMIINAGIRRVVCAESYTQEMAVDLLREAGVEMLRWMEDTWLPPG